MDTFETKENFSTFELNDLVELYNSPIKIRAGIVPPDLPNQREPGSPLIPNLKWNFVNPGNHVKGYRRNQ